MQKLLVYSSKRWTMVKKQRIILTLVILLLLAIFILSGVMIWRELSGRQKDKDNFHTLAELVAPENSITAGTVSSMTEATEGTEGMEPTSEEPDAPVHKRNLAPLYEQNSDCIGWVSIPDTGVDYPVMHTPDEPQRYLRLNFYGEYSRSGVPFLDGRCSLESSNLILFGHNMKDGTMFSAVTGYADEDYAKEHPVIEFETADGCRTYAVFAAVAVQDTNAWYDFIDAADRESFDRAVSAIRERAQYTTDAAPVYGKQLLTLSTCYGESSSDRLIVVCTEP